MTKFLTYPLLFLFLKIKYVLSNKRGEGKFPDMIIGPIDYFFGNDKTEKYAIDLSFLNTLKDHNQLSDKEYSNIKAFLKSKYRIAWLVST